MLHGQCAFPAIFAPPAPPTLPKRYGSPPPAYVFAPQPGGSISPGERITIEMRLLERERGRLPYVAYALKQAAEQGMGRGRGRLALIGIEQWRGQGWARIGGGPGEALTPLDHATVPPAPPCLEAVRVTLHSPMRLRRAGRNVTPETLTALDFLMALTRRVYLLAVLDGDVLEPDWAGLRARAASIELVPASLRWREVPRNSSRQGRMRAGGIVGSFMLQGDLTPFWTPLWLGQWLHVGHLACMGLGAYGLEAAKLGRSVNGPG
ncbi:MAG: CRISPR system precrRNA processing endoribonuclease RAMP protein Cas6 [Mariprofundaceae bacterium]